MNKLDAILCAIAVLNKKKEERPTGGMKFENKGREIKAKYQDIIDALVKEAERVDIKVNHCKTCGSYNSTISNTRGFCFPKNFNSGKFDIDYCSGWVEKAGMKNEE